MGEILHQGKERKEGVYQSYVCGKQTKYGICPWASPHYHDYIELLYCLEGHGKYISGEQSGTFSKGDLVLFNSQEVHATYALDENRTTYVCIRLDPQMIFSSSSQTAFEIKYMLPFTQCNAKHQSIFTKAELEDTIVPQLIMRMLEESEKKNYGFELAIRSATCDLFLWILRYWREQNVDLDIGPRISSEDAKILSAAIHFMETNYENNITLADVAKSVAMSYSGFSKLFNRCMQKKFGEHLAEIRISKAQQLLATSADSVTEIAMKTGYTSTSYFIQQFKEHTGITPKQFKEKFDK